MSSCNLNFSDYGEPFNTSNWERSNPDISGIGVLVGFVTTAYMTLSIVGIYYMMSYVPEDFLNSIDRGIIHTLWRRAHSKPAKSWEPTFRTAVLMFSDQQLVTGIALLTSGYVQLPCGLSSYHWQMIVYLAWFSSLTHLTTLTILRQYFRENPTSRLWRAALMLILFTMLGFALLPTGDGLWFTSINNESSDDVIGQPALCYFRRLVAQTSEKRFQFDAIQTSSMFISITVLFSGYLTRLIKLSKKATIFTKLWIRTKPGCMLKKALKNSIQRAREPNAIMYWRLKHLFLETTYILLRACFDIYESTLWEILWLAFALAWGTCHLFFTRSFMVQAEDDSRQENTWGFGQVFPVILLALPILSIAESYYEKRRVALGEGQNSTHSLQSDTRHGPPQDTRRPQFLRIGQWPSRLTPTLASASDVLETHNAIRRTATDLQNEELNIGNNCPRTSSDEKTLSENEHESGGVSRPHDTFPAGVPAVSDDQGLRFFCDYYQFEWFRILIGVVLLMISEVAIFVIVMFRIIVRFWLSFPQFVAIALFFLLLYTGAFVVLMEYHEAVGTSLYKHAHLPPRLQHVTLRVCTYIYACGVIVAVGLKFWLIPL